MRIHIHYYVCTMFYIYSPSIPITDVDLHKKNTISTKLWFVIILQGLLYIIYYILCIGNVNVCSVMN